MTLRPYRNNIYTREEVRTRVLKATLKGIRVSKNLKIKEVARITDKKIELGESRKKVLNEKIMILMNQIKEKPFVKVTYFVSDQNKDGGTYQVIEGHIRRIDEVIRYLYFIDSSKISLDDILDISIL